ncbi:MAG: LPS-assembly protein LptD, partial [Gammaproteobacteria bacterium]
MRTVAIATPFIVLISSVVCAQSPEAAGSVRGISCWPEPEPILLSEELQDDVIEMSASDVDITGDGNALFKGPVTMRSREMSLTASSASYDSNSATFTATGGIKFQDRGNKVSAQSVIYDTRNEIFSFTDGEFELPQTPARGSATFLEATRSGFLRMDNVVYTSCPAGNRDWILKAKSI